MRVILFILLSIICFSLTAQDKYIFDTSKVDASTKLIGRYPQFDKKQTYKEFNFIITDPEVIKQVIMKMPLGKEVENVIEENEFRINVVRNFKEVKTWSVSPYLKTVLSNGHSYQFDVDILQDLARRYPFDYRFDKIPFASEPDYIEYREKQKTNTSFLFDYAPQFKYEGSFEIEFPSSRKFSSPKAISDYLKPIIEKIVREDEYMVMYFLSEKNKKDQSQFTMTINGSKKLFEQLSVGNLRKENWKETTEMAWFFYQTR